MASDKGLNEKEDVDMKMESCLDKLQRTCADNTFEKIFKIAREQNVNLTPDEWDTVWDIYTIAIPPPKNE